MTLSVVRPNRLGTLPHDTFWLYADNDLLGYSLAASHLGEGERLLSPSEFQSEIARYRSTFLVWVDQVLTDRPADDWIPASFFKDMYCTPVFLHGVCIAIAIEAIRANKNLLVVTRSGILAKQLQNICIEEKVKFDCFGNMQFLVGRFLKQWREGAHVLYHPCLIALRIFIARWMLGSTYRDCLRDTQIVVETFLFEEDITPTGEFRDRFLPGLVAWYRRQGLTAASLPYTGNIPLHKMVNVFRRMKRSETLFAPGELFLQLRDLFKGIFRAMHAAMFPPDFGRFPFGGTKMAILAKYWWRISAFNTVIFQVWREMPGRMSQNGLVPRLALDWFENQPLDKAMTIGFLRDVQKTEVIALRQYFPAAGVVNFFSTDAEVRAGVSPAVNWVCGRRTAELFSAHDSIGRYDVVPALRYSHLFDQGGSNSVTGKLVLFLTSSLEESLGIIACVLEGSDSVMRRFGMVCIKPHQALRGNFADIVSRRWPDTRQLEISWELRSTSELLDEAELVVTAGSSVALEAVCRGVPVVVIGRPAGLNLNPLEDVDDQLWRLAYDSKDFSRMVNQWLPAIPPLDARRALGSDIRARYFQPPTISAMSAFLPQWAGKTHDSSQHII